MEEDIRYFSYSGCDIGILLLVLLLIVLFLTLVSVLIYQIVIRILGRKIEREPVVGKVVDKEYRRSYTTMVHDSAIKSMTSVYHPEEYNVTVQYGNIFKTFNKAKLFRQYEKGDDIPLILVQRLNKKGKKIGKPKLELQK